MPIPLTQNPDGASTQSQIVLAILRDRIGDGIDESWDAEAREYGANPQVSRWENVKEQGYIIRMPHHVARKQINVIFFENRGSDDVDVVMFETAISLHTFHVHTLPEDLPFTHSGEVTRRFSSGQWKQTADYIYEALTAFWATNSGGR